MRVRIIRGFYYAKRGTRYVPDDVVDAPEEDAQLWLKHGIAMRDKSVDPSEVKGIPVPTESLFIEEPKKAPAKKKKK